MFKPQISHAILKTCEILPAWISLLYLNRWHGFWGWNIETCSCFPAHSSELPLAAQSCDLDVSVTAVKTKMSLKELGKSEEQCTPWSTRNTRKCFKIQNPPILRCCPASDITLLPKTHQRNKERNTPMFCRLLFIQLRRWQFRSLTSILLGILHAKSYSLLHLFSCLYLIT